MGICTEWFVRGGAVFGLLGGEYAALGPRDRVGFTGWGLEDNPLWHWDLLAGST